jgi:branched-chain amino acid transport system ATP-binding protein
MLIVEDLHSYYGAAHVLQGVSLSVAPGEVVALLGRNGIGKSTLVRSIMGLTPPSVGSGKIVYRDTVLNGLAPYAIARLGLGLVPQGRRVFRSLSVTENLHVAASEDGAGGGDPWTDHRIYELFPRLDERRTTRAGSLSGGEQQMLAIARALMINPSSLIMDEPSEGLAPIVISAIRDRLGALKGSGLSILLVEQNLGLALAMADRIFLLGGTGQTVWEGTPDELQADTEAMEVHLGV